MKKNVHLLTAILLIILIGCGVKDKTRKTPDNDNEVLLDRTQNSPYEEAPEAIMDTVTGYLKKGTDDERYNPLTSSAARGFAGDTTRKFIKTADLKFRTGSVIRTTYAIEDLTHHFGGFVTYTRLDSRIDNTTVIPVSPDSCLETVYYTVVNAMTIRVPENKLDSMLRSLSPLIEYLDYRTVVADDVYLKMLANQLAQQRIAKYQNRMKNNVDRAKPDLGDANSSEESMLNRQEQADNALIETLSLKDRIEFSTITLNIYQRQAIKRELIWNNKNIEAYEPGFGYKLGQSLKSGWNAFLSIILFLARLWILAPLAVIGYIGFRLWRKKGKW